MDHQQAIINYARKLISLTDEEAIEFGAAFKELKVKKRQFVIQPEFTAKSRYFVLKGSLRAYVVGNEGQDHTIQLAIEEWWISDYNSYIFQQPGSMFVMAMEDSLLLQITHDNVAFNAYGATAGLTDYTVSRQSIFSANSPALPNSYKTFLSLPDTTLFVPSAYPAAPIVGKIYGCPGQYYIPYKTFANGDVRIFLDLNGTPGFQDNSADRYLYAYDVSAGNNVLVWDGLNGLGAAVTVGGSANIQVTTLRGRTNMPLMMPNGIWMALLLIVLSQLLFQI
jgi:hypothetical protein